MNRAAENVYTAIRRDGTQATVIDTMQTREELYQAINYYEYEKALDETFGNEKKTGK
jgi:methylisocitrate lyase